MCVRCTFHAHSLTVLYHSFSSEYAPDRSYMVCVCVCVCPVCVCVCLWVWIRALCVACAWSCRFMNVRAWCTLCECVCVCVCVHSMFRDVGARYVLLRRMCVCACRLRVRVCIYVCARALTPSPSQVIPLNLTQEARDDMLQLATDTGLCVLDACSVCVYPGCVCVRVCVCMCCECE